MKIRMLKTQRGSPDGVSLETYTQGETYDLTGTVRERDLAAAFIRYGWAEEVKAKPAHEVAAVSPAVENKGATAFPRRK